MTGPPCILHEDEHLLVVNKPAGWNTHSPSPYAGEGLYDWLRHREARWASLAIIHRLDKETSGLLVFGRTALANRSLTAQFTDRRVQKTYLLLTVREPTQQSFTVASPIRRAGDHYESGPGGEAAETRFHTAGTPPGVPGRILLLALPRTGRTHQIRVHAADSGVPILGDSLYGGAPFPRVCLHAAALTLEHPATGAPVTFEAPVDFGADPRLALREALIDRAATNSFRVLHGASDGWPGWFVDRYGDTLLSQAEGPLSPAQRQHLAAGLGTARQRYHKRLSRHPGGAATGDSSPRPVAAGEPGDPAAVVHENGVRFEIRFDEGYSVGLFLDQRDNRRRLLTRHVAAGFELPPPAERLEVLNTFAYTCGFSACAARGGAATTSLDLSRKYLAWGRRNFELNGLDPDGHEFIYGDAFDWLRRLAKKQRAFDAVLLDPPTFSRSRASGPFRAEEDYGTLVTAALPVLRPGGVLFAATNAARLPPDRFLEQVRAAIRGAGRTVRQEHYAPQAPDFPICRAEPGYLKTAWFRVG